MGLPSKEASTGKAGWEQGSQVSVNFLFRAPCFVLFGLMFGAFGQSAPAQAADVVKVDMLINGDRIDALSLIVHRTQSQYRGREVAAKMREIIPRQMYDVAIQAAIGANIIARENIKALRKNVLAKCYGGDITRKRKLLEKQKAGKKRMKQIGSVEVPQEAFLAILQVDD